MKLLQIFCQFSCKFGCCLLGQECDSNVGYWQARPAPTLRLSPTICIPAFQVPSHPVSRVAKKKKLRYFCPNFLLFFAQFLLVLAWIVVLVTVPTRANSTHCLLSPLNCLNFWTKKTIVLFKASALWADAFYKLKCLSVCGSVCLSVCSLLRYCLNIFLPPLRKVRCPIFLEIQNPWEKVMQRSGLRFEHFSLEVV